MEDDFLMFFFHIEGINSVSSNIIPENNRLFFLKVAYLLKAE